MDKISEVTIGSCEKSNFIKPKRIHYKQVSNRPMINKSSMLDLGISTKFIITFNTRFINPDVRP